MSRGTRCRSSLALSSAVLALALVVPAGAAAVTRPAATTGAASNVGQSSATLNATVNPNGGQAGYYFQFGASRAYGGQTALVIVGKGTKPVHVSQGIGGLAPATTYHYRVIAQNPKGRAFGKDRTFKTRRQPLGVSLAGNPNPVHVGDAAVLSGTLSGTGNAGRQVLLQSNPWPYTQGFMNDGNPQVTDASGNFSFPILSVPVNTQFRVLMPQKPGVVSPIVVEGTTVRVTTHVRVHRRAHSGRVHLYGSLYPPTDGTQVVVQKLVGGAWKNVGGSTFARHRNSTRSTYTKSFWQRHGGKYRVYVNAQGPRVPSVGRTATIRRTKR